MFGSGILGLASVVRRKINLQAINTSSVFHK